MKTFNDFYPTSDIQVIDIIKNFLGTKRKIINANYSRNDFYAIKKRYPLFWSYVKNKSFKVDDKLVNFYELGQQYILINGKKFKRSNRNKISAKVFEVVAAFNFNKFELKAFIKYCIKNNQPGFRILMFLKKYFPNDYAKVMEYSIGSNSERETIWRFLNNIKEKPQINGIPLLFLTYGQEYEYYELYLQYLQLKDKNNEIDLAKLCLKQKQPTTVLKKYFHDLYEKINQKPAKYFSTKMWMFVNNTNESPKCQLCGKPVKERKDFTNFRFCSQQCARQNISLEAIKKAQMVYGKEWNKYWLSYFNLVTKLTEYSYKKFKKEINPWNLKRGRGCYHLDHKIPKIYGFLNKIDPKIISHYLNLQMLPESENCSKQNKLIFSEIDLKKLINRINLEIKKCDF